MGAYYGRDKADSAEWTMEARDARDAGGSSTWTAQLPATSEHDEDEAENRQPPGIKI